MTLTPGTIVRIKNTGTSHKITVRVLAGQQFTRIIAGQEYTMFHGIRVRPAELNISFGNSHVYTARTAEIEIIQPAKPSLRDVLTTAAHAERARRETAGGTWPSLDGYGPDTLSLNPPATLASRIGPA